MKSKILLSCLLVLCAFFARGQDDSGNEWSHAGQVNFGCSINLHYGTGQRYPSIRIFGGFGISAVYKDRFILNYGASFAAYTKTLGANLNPLIGDMQADLVNSFTVGGAYGHINYTKYFNTFSNAPYYNVALQSEYALLLSSNVILNRCKRNQIVGSVTASFPKLTVNYYNDGAPPINWFAWGLGDGFDRWWTGGTSFYAHTTEGYNWLEVSFDQFTGYAPLLYELSNVIGINVPVYEIDTTHVAIDDISSPPAFNTSAYNIKYYPQKGYAVDLGVIGSLRSKGSRPRYWALQDLIHMSLGHALHPNNDVNRIYIGGTYNNMTDVTTR